MSNEEWAYGILNDCMKKSMDALKNHDNAWKGGIIHVPAEVRYLDNEPVVSYEVFCPQKKDKKSDGTRAVGECGTEPTAG